MTASSKNRKKKRISKHVLKAKEEIGAAATTETATTTTQPKKKRKKHHIKDPAEAVTYLSSWKHRDAGGGWKFNKNTQSWLLRHMYETDKVSKSSFELLLEYMEGLQGEHILARLIQDAERRAMRYKKYEKQNDGASKDTAKEPITEEKDVEEQAKPGDNDDSDGGDDTRRWERLDAHEKRKEYKRARKVLEALRRNDKSIAASHDS